MGWSDGATIWLFGVLDAPLTTVIKETNLDWVLQAQRTDQTCFGVPLSSLLLLYVCTLGTDGRCDATCECAGGESNPTSVCVDTKT
jgi:hypothetical protein